MKRRHFLQFTGSSFAAIALSHIDIQSKRLHRTLAQASGRKLALLVGINQYSHPRINDLSGCLNDVRLQYELLVHRYKFDPQDIVIVSEASLNLPAKELIAPPTRQAIIDAFQNHLIAQAQRGDAVVFHYSGHGTYVRDPYPISYDTEAEYLGLSNFENFKAADGKYYNGAIVPADVLDGTAQGEANVIMGTTIFLLCNALKTDNVTLIFDSCHSGGGVRGNLVYRATLENTDVMPSQAELAFQEELIADLRLTRDRLQEMRQTGIAKGVAMTSARATQLAAETTVGNFQSGIFTYLLTRYLWQTASSRPLNQVFADLARITRSQADDNGGSQDPIYFTKPGTMFDTQPPYLMSAATPAADAVVRSVKPDGTLEFWLGGLTPRALEQAESIFELIDDQGNVLGQVGQTQREGLLGYGNLLSEGVTVQPGMLMREHIRGIPSDIRLRVGIHESLGDDAALARQILTGFDRVTVVEVNGQNATDYLLGRWDDRIRIQVQQQGGGDRVEIQALENNSLGLFSNALDPLPTTFGSQYEEIGSALERLSTRLRLLLANRTIKTILNREASELKVEVMVSSNQRSSIEIVRSGSQDRPNLPTQFQIAQMQIGEEMMLQVTNQESRSLYVAVISTEREGALYVYHPSHWDAAELDAELSPGESLVIPKQDDIFFLPIQGPPGYFEVLVIASTEPLRDTLQSLRRLSDRSISRGQLITFTENEERSRGSGDSAFSIVEDILGDLNRASAVPQLREQYNVNTARLAALSVTIEAIEA